MKSKLFYLFICLITFTGYSQEVPVQLNQIPSKAQSFLEQHFKSEFHHAMKTAMNKKIKYDVFLDDDTEIEFSDAGRWTVVNGKSKAVPYTFIQKQILDYIKIHHEGDAIVKIQRTDLNYKTTLSSGLDLHFDKLGVFVK